jgi:death-on-curing protein
MVLMPWVNGCGHDFSTDAAFDLVVGVAAGDVSLGVRAGTIATDLVSTASRRVGGIAGWAVS